ncbi:MAG TPA: hypothetical protein DD658_02980 [Deltaproteobacteria bacterium]|nr:hypothetical protein [Deltaproteobacteria bacterium]
MKGDRLNRGGTPLGRQIEAAVFLTGDRVVLLHYFQGFAFPSRDIERSIPGRRHGPRKAEVPALSQNLHDLSLAIQHGDLMQQRVGDDKVSPQIVIPEPRRGKETDVHTGGHDHHGPFQTR